MRRHRPLAAFVFALLALSAATAQVTDWRQVKIPTLPAFHPAEPRRIVLPNGMVIFLQEDHELPLIDGVVRIRGGSRDEPAAKTGLVDIYGEVWRTGGTLKRTGDQLDDFLEARAAKVETGGAMDSTLVSFSCLKADFDDVFSVFVELLQQPAFRDEKIALAKFQANTGISRRNDDIGEIASRESVKLAYGPTSPYARVAEYATIAAITRDDLVNWHKTYVHPNNMIVGIVGDFDSATLEAKLRQIFEALPKGPPLPKTQIEFHPAKPGIYFVPKNDVNQSAIRMVTLGTTRRNPDYYAIEAFNEAFGGGFASRLFNDLRSKMGLAYSVGGGIGTAFDHDGIFRLVIGTKSATTIESIQALRQELADLKTNPINNDEVKRARDSILNSFIFNFDTPDKVLRERMAYEFYGYPLDFLEQYRAGIEKVTAQDVDGIVPKYVHPDQFAVLVVGNAREFEKPLSSLGPVTTIDISIPPPPKQAAGAPPAQ
jgi:zinc protease